MPLGLLALGVGKADRVGVWSPTWAEGTYVHHSTARAGPEPVPANPA